MAQVKFEEAIKRLEEIVAALEKGNLSLEDSLRIFEEGVKLSKSCLKILDDAEKKVEILLKEKDGKRRLKPFRITESEPEDFEGSEDRDE
jgi:exodeoxyribonuclease VII small subunit